MSSLPRSIWFIAVAIVPGLGLSLRGGEAQTGYTPLPADTVRIWDTTKKLEEKHYDFRAWADRATWTQVPYGTAAYEFRGETVLEGKNFWISLHSSKHDAVFLYLKMDGEGSPSRHNEIYRAWDTSDGKYCNYGMGSQKVRILKNEPGEIVVESEAFTGNRKGFETTVTTAYRILGGRQWVEIRPVKQASQQGMHGETRIIVAPEAGQGGNDWADDSTKHPDAYPTKLPLTSKLLLDLALDIDAIWVMTWPDPAKARPNSCCAYGGWPSGWQRIGEGKAPPVWTAPFAWYGDAVQPVYIGALFNGYWIYQKIGRPVKEGEKLTGQWRWSHEREIRGTPWKKGEPWRPSYPGKWRLIGCVDGKYYTNEVTVAGADVSSDAFSFSSPAAGTLEYLVFYLYDRTDQTPKDLVTPMDIYRQTQADFKERADAKK
jgi:hypothetical protein